MVPRAAAYVRPGSIRFVAGARWVGFPLGLRHRVRRARLEGTLGEATTGAPYELAREGTPPASPAWDYVHDSLERPSEGPEKDEGHKWGMPPIFPLAPLLDAINGRYITYVLFFLTGCSREP